MFRSSRSARNPSYRLELSFVHRRELISARAAIGPPHGGGLAKAERHSLVPRTLTLPSSATARPVPDWPADTRRAARGSGVPVRTAGTGIPCMADSRLPRYPNDPRHAYSADLWRDATPCPGLPGPWSRPPVEEGQCGTAQRAIRSATHCGTRSRRSAAPPPSVPAPPATAATYGSSDRCGRACATGPAR